MMQEKIVNRIEAGRSLAKHLISYKQRDDVILLALPRGGVPIAYEIARVLELPLDVIIVRKLGIPHHKEFAMGSVAQGGICILNKEIINLYKISDQAVARVVESELHELNRRENLYRDNCSPPELQGKCVILVDDGLATGSTMEAAIQAVKRQGAGKVVIAVPVASSHALQKFKTYTDEIICLIASESFQSVGQWYEEFPQVSDEEVLHFLRLSKRS